MHEYGYNIVKVLISDIVPDPKVKAAMNDINAAQREREATVSRAETNKLLAVKQAEAEAESKRLQGEGIANQRRAIIAGLKDSIEDFSKAVAGATPHDVMQLVLITQYFDTKSPPTTEPTLCSFRIRPAPSPTSSASSATPWSPRTPSPRRRTSPAQPPAA